MIVSSTFLKLPYMIKLAMLTTMTAIYVILAKTAFSEVFSRQQSCGISLLDNG